LRNARRNQQQYDNRSRGEPPKIAAVHKGCAKPNDLKDCPPTNTQKGLEPQGPYPSASKTAAQGAMDVL
jgi:hypothetical protein